MNSVLGVERAIQNTHKARKYAFYAGGEGVKSVMHQNTIYYQNLYTTYYLILLYNLYTYKSM